MFELQNRQANKDKSNEIPILSRQKEYNFAKLSIHSSALGEVEKTNLREFEVLEENPRF